MVSKLKPIIAFKDHKNPKWWPFSLGHMIIHSLASRASMIILVSVGLWFNEYNGIRSKPMLNGVEIALIA